MATATLTMASALATHFNSSLVSWTLIKEQYIGNELFVNTTNTQLSSEDHGETMSDSDSASSDPSEACYSPTTVETNSNISMAGRRERRKRKRMSEDERKVRHREVQREFMKRKRARIAVLRKVVSGVEKQLKLVTILQEIETLKKENDELIKQYEAVQASPVLDTSRSVMACFTDENGKELVFSLPKEETNDEDDEDSRMMEITDFEWDEILDVLSQDDITCNIFPQDVDDFLPRC